MIDFEIFTKFLDLESYGNVGLIDEISYGTFLKIPKHPFRVFFHTRSNDKNII